MGSNPTLSAKHQRGEDIRKYVGTDTKEGIIRRFSEYVSSVKAVFLPALVLILSLVEGKDHIICMGCNGFKAPD